MQQFAIHSPGTTPPVVGTSDDAFTLVRRCGRRVLTPDDLSALRALSQRLDVHDWDTVLGRARQHGLQSLVFTHLAQANLLLQVPTHVVAQLRSAYCATLVVNRRLEIELGRVLAAFAARGVEPLLLKGTSLAARYYREIALRPSTDIDVLIQRQQLRQCLLALRDIGYTPKAGKGKALDFAVLYSWELDYRNRSGVRVEPHLELARLPAYRAALAIKRVWARAETISVGGIRARYLHPWDELCYLSMHYSVPHKAGRLIWLVDIAELVRTQAGDWDWDGFVGETVARGVAIPVVVALQHAQRLLDLELPPAVIPCLRAAATTPGEQAAWLAAHASLSDAGRLGRHLLSLPGLLEKLAFIWGAGIVGGRKTLRQLGRVRTARRGSASEGRRCGYRQGARSIARMNQTSHEQ